MRKYFKTYKYPLKTISTDFNENSIAEETWEFLYDSLVMGTSWGISAVRTMLCD